MQKNLWTRLIVLTLLVALAIAFIPREAQAGTPRGGGDLFKKYSGKIVRSVAVGPWTPWRWTSAVQICINGLWSFDYTRWRTVTKTYWLGDRWLSWAWLDHNIVFYERWKNLTGPYDYTIMQRQVKQVYWFDPLRYDPRFPNAEVQVFDRDALLWADWTRIDGIVDPGTGVPVLSHRVFFDEQLYYEHGPMDPDRTDAMVVSLGDYPAGPHTIRIEATWANGTVSPGFLLVPLVSRDYLEVEVQIVGPAFAGKLNRLPNAIRVHNNLDEPRAVYFKTVTRTNSNVQSFFDIFADVDIPGNGTVIQPNVDSFFDVFVAIPPHTPPGEIIEVEIVALSLVSANPIAVVHGGTDGQSTPPATLDIPVAPPPQYLKVQPMVTLANNTMYIEGFGYTPNSEVGLTSSFFDVFFDVIVTDTEGHFRYAMPIPSDFKPYGQHAIAAIDLNDGTSATADTTISGADINGDGIIDIYDLIYLAVHFGETVRLSTALSIGAVATVVPIGTVFLYKRRQKRLKELDN